MEFFLSLYSSFFFFFFPWSFFFISIHLLSLIYLHLHHILTIHFHLTPFLFWHLLLLSFEEDGRRNLISCDLHYLGHFLINVANKTIVYHLIQMHATSCTRPEASLMSPDFLSLFRFQLPLRVLQSTLIYFFPSLSGFLPRARGIPTPKLQPFNFLIGPWAPTDHIVNNIWLIQILTCVLRA